MMFAGKEEDGVDEPRRGTEAGGECGPDPGHLVRTHIVVRRGGTTRPRGPARGRAG